jgi:7,8-dihydropterin-6-yl-methyl-4-(beta-D-ribofuranosyl)aminobenzene 5'-phosphate synthase
MRHFGYRSGVPRRPLLLLVWTGVALAGAAGPAQGDPPGEKDRTPRLRSVRITILSTMLADTRGLGEWGFAALVESDGHRLPGYSDKTYTYGVP